MTLLVKPTECMKRRFFACLILASVALSLVGAGEITSVLNERRARKVQLSHDSKVFVQKLMAELPEKERMGWEASDKEKAVDSYFFME